MPRPSKKTTFGIAGLLNATSKKTAALVVWLHFSSSISNVSSFDAASPQKAINLAGCPPSTPHLKNNQPVVWVVCLCISISIGDVASSNAASPQNNKQPAALLASLQCHIQKKIFNLQCCWFGTSVGNISFFDAASLKKQSTFSISGLLHATSKKASNLQRWWFGSAFPAALVTLLCCPLPPGLLAVLLQCHVKKTINLRHCWLALHFHHHW